MEDQVTASEKPTLDGETLANALDAADVGVWEWDLTSAELFFSETLTKIFGLAPGTFDRTVESFNALVHPDDQRRVADAIDRAHFEGVPYDIEYSICPPSGGRRWIAAKGQAIRNTRSEPLRMIGVAWEISQRKEVDSGLAARALQQSAVASSHPRNSFR